MSIGIPTYNRVALLKRALQSALDQDYPRLEVLVSNNASADGTGALCAEFVQRDPRVRYFELPVNRGPMFNFSSVLAAARGEYFMWLADDDWLERGFVSRCVRKLRDDPGLVMVSGLTLWHATAGAPPREEPIREYAQHEPWRRAVVYLAQVAENSTFYSLARRRAAVAAALPNRLAADWIFVVHMLLQGGCAALPEAVLNRSAGGESVSMDRIVDSFRLPQWHKRLPWMLIAWNCAAAVYTGVRRLRQPPLRALYWAALAFWILALRHTWWRRFYPRPRRTEWLRRFVARNTAEVHSG